MTGPAKNCWQFQVSMRRCSELAHEPQPCLTIHSAALVKLGSACANGGDLRPIDLRELHLRFLIIAMAFFTILPPTGSYSARASASTMKATNDSAKYSSAEVPA